MDAWTTPATAPARPRRPLSASGRQLGPRHHPATTYSSSVPTGAWIKARATSGTPRRSVGEKTAGRRGTVEGARTSLQSGFPAWTRTRTNRTKTCCATDYTTGKRVGKEDTVRKVPSQTMLAPQVVRNSIDATTNLAGFRSLAATSRGLESVHALGGGPQGDPFPAPITAGATESLRA